MSFENTFFPDESKLQKRFHFIQDKTLCKNIIITFRYIIFLLELEKTLPHTIKYSLYKDIIIQTATIVESCVHYTLQQFLATEKEKSSDILYEWKEEKCVVLEIFDNGNKEGTPSIIA